MERCASRYFRSMRCGDAKKFASGWWSDTEAEKTEDRGLRAEREAGRDGRERKEERFLI